MRCVVSAPRAVGFSRMSGPSTTAAFGDIGRFGECASVGSRGVNDRVEVRHRGGHLLIEHMVVVTEAGLGEVERNAGALANERRQTVSAHSRSFSARCSDKIGGLRRCSGS